MSLGVTLCYIENFVTSLINTLKIKINKNNLTQFNVKLAKKHF